MACKGICSSNTSQYFNERRTSKTNNFYTVLYDGITKYCRTCSIYIKFKTMDEYNNTIQCPCCHYKMRYKPYTKIDKLAYMKRRNIKEPVRY